MVLYTSDNKVLGDKRIKRWPADKSRWEDKRTVRVSINSWRGISVGAIHWNLTIEEEDNQFWSESEDCWCKISCMGDDGVSLSAKCFKREDCIALAKRFIELVCHDGHRVTWDGYDDDDDDVFDAKDEELFEDDEEDFI